MTTIYQLFWGSLGTRVLTHPHMKNMKHIWLEMAERCEVLHVLLLGGISMERKTSCALAFKGVRIGSNSLLLRRPNFTRRI